eukprot:gene16215-17847_t
MNQFRLDSAHQTVRRNVENGKQQNPENDVQLIQDDKSKGKGVIVNEKAHPWDTWWSMVKERHVTSPQMARREVEEILKELATAKIIEADVGSRGTQLKASLKLDGPEMQTVVFKPMRYPRDHVIRGNIYDGFDRHNGEIAAFHLDRILGFYRAPPVVGRRIDLEKELKPVAKQKLLNTFFKKVNRDVCFYGVCYYCKKSEAACGNGNIMEGSITIWLPHGWELKNNRHPWQRTYRNDKIARWQLDPSYCKDIVKVAPYDSGPRLLDIIDTSIFDFLIGNGDRHHYETFKKGGPHGLVLHLDNAKSFGNHFQDEMSILAPLEQCCRIRKSTHARLKEFSQNSSSPDSLSSKMRESLRFDPVYPVLTDLHILALDRRLTIALSVIENCIEKNGIQNVIIKDEF